MHDGVVAIGAPARWGSFDPLVTFHGLWTTDLAERYLPIEGAPPAKYECVDGKLILSRDEAGPNVHAADELRTVLKPAVRAAGLRLYTTVNLRINSMRWIQPDFTVVRTPVIGTWVEAEDAVLVGEFVSPSSRVRDRIDKPAICAEAGIPFWLSGQVSLAEKYAAIQLSTLVDGKYELVTTAEAGQLFEVDEPFPMSFDPVQLLDL
jgi:Uma2 family endonuclease